MLTLFYIYKYIHIYTHIYSCISFIIGLRLSYKIIHTIYKAVPYFYTLYGVLQSLMITIALYYHKSITRASPPVIFTFPLWTDYRLPLLQPEDTAVKWDDTNVFLSLVSVIPELQIGTCLCACMCTCVWGFMHTYRHLDLVRELCMFMLNLLGLNKLKVWCLFISTFYDFQYLPCTALKNM